MSIYPKRISSEENLIIHLRFSNKSKKIQKLKYVLSILNPNNKQIYFKEDNLILGSNNEEYIKELYYSFFIDETYIPGKYNVIFYLILNGKKIESVTKDNDFFIVEKLTYYSLKNKTIIINNSYMKTRVKLYGKEKEEEINIEGNQRKIINHKYDYIEFANNKIDKINKRR